MPAIIVLFIALLGFGFGFADAGLIKTPRTASLSPSLSAATPTRFVATTTTTTTPSVPMATAPTNNINNDNNIKIAAAAPAVPTEPGATPAGTSASGPETTPPPKQNDEDLGGVWHELYGQKYTQTTYWSCATFPLETHCGWHEPILEVQGGGAGGSLAAVRAGAVAGVVAVAGGMVLGDLI